MDTKRKYGCVRYRKCLSVAAARNDPHMLCEECSRYKASPGLRPREYNGCIKLLEAVFNVNPRKRTLLRKAGHARRITSDSVYRI